MTDRPLTSYTRTGAGVHVAFQATGLGLIDLVVFPDGMIPMDAMRELPASRRFLEGLAAFGRVISFDRRGTGLSDPVSPEHPPTLEQWASDTLAVLDAVDSERSAVLGMAEGGFVAAFLAATRPERVSHLVLINATPGYTAGSMTAQGSAYATLERLRGTLDEEWGEVDLEIPLVAPSAVDDPEYRDWVKRAIRRSLSPAMAAAVFDVLFLSDISGLLGAVRVPTLVIHRRDNRHVTVEHGRYLAEHIPGARLLEVEGRDHVPYVGDQAPILEAVEEFLTGHRPSAFVRRFLTTFLLTDIVGSTEVVARIGDARWRELLAEHDHLARLEFSRYQGEEVDHTGDGFLATFDGPARAVRCAQALSASVDRIGLEVRSGVHTGECELEGERITGLAVHLAARIADLAGPGEILVSKTVKELVAGSGLAFTDRGTHRLRGVPEEWRVFAVRS